MLKNNIAKYHRKAEILPRVSSVCSTSGKKTIRQRKSYSSCSRKRITRKHRIITTNLHPTENIPLISRQYIGDENPIRKKCQSLGYGKGGSQIIVKHRINPPRQKSVSRSEHIRTSPYTCQLASSRMKTTNSLTYTSKMPKTIITPVSRIGESLKPSSTPLLPFNVHKSTSKYQTSNSKPKKDGCADEQENTDDMESMLVKFIEEEYESSADETYEYPTQGNICRLCKSDRLPMPDSSSGTTVNYLTDNCLLSQSSLSSDYSTRWVPKNNNIEVKRNDHIGLGSQLGNGHTRRLQERQSLNSTQNKLSRIKCPSCDVYTGNSSRHTNETYQLCYAFNFSNETSDEKPRKAFFRNFPPLYRLRHHYHNPRIEGTPEPTERMPDTQEGTHTSPCRKLCKHIYPKLPLFCQPSEKTTPMSFDPQKINQNDTLDADNFPSSENRQPTNSRKWLSQQSFKKVLQGFPYLRHTSHTSLSPVHVSISKPPEKQQTIWKHSEFKSPKDLMEKVISGRHSMTNLHLHETESVIMTKEEDLTMRLDIECLGEKHLSPSEDIYASRIDTKQLDRPTSQDISSSRTLIIPTSVEAISSKEVGADGQHPSRRSQQNDKILLPSDYSVTGDLARKLQVPYEIRNKDNTDNTAKLVVTSKGQLEPEEEEEQDKEVSHPPRIVDMNKNIQHRNEGSYSVSLISHSSMNDDASRRSQKQFLRVNGRENDTIPTEKTQTTLGKLAANNLKLNTNLYLPESDTENTMNLLVTLRQDNMKTPDLYEKFQSYILNFPLTLQESSVPQSFEDKTLSQSSKDDDTGMKMSPRIEICKIASKDSVMCIGQDILEFSRPESYTPHQMEGLLAEEDGVTEVSKLNEPLIINQLETEVDKVKAMNLQSHKTQLHFVPPHFDNQSKLYYRDIKTRRKRIKRTNTMRGNRLLYMTSERVQLKSYGLCNYDIDKLQSYQLYRAQKSYRQLNPSYHLHEELTHRRLLGLHCIRDLRMIIRSEPIIHQARPINETRICFDKKLKDRPQTKRVASNAPQLEFHQEVSTLSPDAHGIQISQGVKDDMYAYASPYEESILSLRDSQDETSQKDSTSLSEGEVKILPTTSPFSLLTGKSTRKSNELKLLNVTSKLKSTLKNAETLSCLKKTPKPRDIQEKSQRNRPVPLLRTKSHRITKADSLQTRRKEYEAELCEAVMNTPVADLSEKIKSIIERYADLQTTDSQVVSPVYTQTRISQISSSESNPTIQGDSNSKGECLCKNRKQRIDDDEKTSLLLLLPDDTSMKCDEEVSAEFSDSSSDEMSLLTLNRLLEKTLKHDELFMSRRIHSSRTSSHDTGGSGGSSTTSSHETSPTTSSISQYLCDEHKHHPSLHKIRQELDSSRDKLTTSRCRSANSHILDKDSLLLLPILTNDHRLKHRKAIKLLELSNSLKEISIICLYHELRRAMKRKDTIRQLVKKILNT
uniref:Uncharacterized protein n=1 Tax=Trichobilharzia regenti TaxID=157069 RepID=A0AA85J740_TRIRE|nr:unnamed protein product [Trichobilharzia regenti]